MTPDTTWLVETRLGLDDLVGNLERGLNEHGQLTGLFVCRIKGKEWFDEGY